MLGATQYLNKLYQSVTGQDSSNPAKVTATPGVVSGKVEAAGEGGDAGAATYQDITFTNVSNPNKEVRVNYMDQGVSVGQNPTVYEAGDSGTHYYVTVEIESGVTQAQPIVDALNSYDYSLWGLNQLLTAAVSGTATNPQTMSGFQEEVAIVPATTPVTAGTTAEEIACEGSSMLFVSVLATGADATYTVEQAAFIDAETALDASEWFQIASGTVTAGTATHIEKDKAGGAVKITVTTEGTARARYIIT